MKVINAVNVNDAFMFGLMHLKNHGQWSGSRNGRAIVAPSPVTTVYSLPQERVLFHPVRDCNPFFHLFESLYMLAGRRDVAFLDQFNKQMRNYSDDGEVFHGTYGFRWRHHWGEDQLALIIALLKGNKNSRRAILTMFDPEADLHVTEELKDLPCNIAIHFQRREISGTERLDMTVFCRSNDIIWGAYGANAVHLSFLHEYIAAMVGLPMGVYHQISSNFHAYEQLFTKLVRLTDGKDTRAIAEADPYNVEGVKPFPLVSDPGSFDSELAVFMEDPDGNQVYSNTFFRHVARPMYQAHVFWRNKASPSRWNDIERALTYMEHCDWKVACVQWMERRKQAAAGGQHAEDAQENR